MVFIGIRYDNFNIFPLSQSQRNIWELEQVYVNNPMNNICTSIRIKGRIDVALVTQCINQVLKHDSALRTRFTLVNGSPFQFHLDYREETFPFFNFSMADEDGFSRWENTIAQMAMPLCESPLYQFYIYKFDEKTGGILIKLHHLIADGWSVVDLANRISSIYLKLLSAEEANIEFMYSYEQHVQNEKKYIESELFEKDRQYWADKVEEFSGERAFLRNNNETNTSCAADRCSFHFPELLNHAIVKFCDQNRIAPFMVYCAALAVFLQRMSGNNQMCLGVPVVNRSGLQDKRTGGMYVNTLPFFLKADIQLCVEELIMNLTEQWYDLLRHHNLPFSEINKLYNQTGCAQRPMFDIVLSYQEGKIFRSSEATMMFSGKWLYSGFQREQLIIHLTCFNGEDRFAIDYDYLTQFYCREDMEFLHKHVVKILAEMIAHPKEPIVELTLMDDHELERVLYTFNQTDGEEAEQSVTEAFLRVVKKSPNDVAVICDDCKITYQNLYERALEIAPHIRSACRGKKEKENIVALCLPRSIDLIAAMLATAFSGNAWLILAPDLPQARLSHILTDSEAAVVVTRRVFAPLLSGRAEELLFLDSLPEMSREGLPCRLNGSDLAYVAYTSGSSGIPKGVMIEQASLTNFSQAMDSVYGAGGVLSICSTGFDVFLSETISALLRGQTIILALDDQCNDPSEIARLITQYAARFTSTVPSRLEAYLSNPEFALAVDRLDRIVVGGEPLSGNLVGKLEKLTKANIYNMYGPTETTIGVSYKCVNQSPSLSAGKPMTNCKLYVLDEYLKPLPVGAFGDLYIGGACVGRGYLNNQESTQKNFIASKFKMGQRMYRSGDIAFWDKSGEINICGRRDAQIKLNGNRVEPQEITAALLAHPQVEQAAVSIIKREGKGAIVAYYTSMHGIEEHNLLEFCATYLPGYMIPQFFVRIEEIPLTANGKLDFSKLPEPMQKQEGRSPLTEMQSLILGIYKRVLKKDDLTIDSSYLQNGGDSLNALSVISEIDRLIGVKISFADIRTLSTPANIALKLEKPLFEPDYATDRAPAAEKGSAFSAQTTYPLTHIQKTIFFSAFSDPTGICYNMPGAFLLPFQPDAKKMEDAFCSLIAAEELLRTSFAFEGAGAVARVHKAADFALERLSAESYTEALKAFVRPFNLGCPPLIRAGLWQKDGQSVLLLDVHHIVNDGEGTPLLLQKLDAHYRAARAESALLSYKDYACQKHKDGVRESNVTYWREKLSGFTGQLMLPPDYPPVAEFDCKGRAFVFSMDPALSGEVEHFCSEQDITPYTLFAAAFGLLLATVSGQNDFAIGAPVAGRIRPETRGMIGPFIHTLPLRVQVDFEQSLNDFLKDVSGDIINLLDHADIGYDDCLSAAGIHRGQGYHGLYNVMFSMRPAYEKTFTLDNQSLVLLPYETNCAKMDLVLEAVKDEENYWFSFEYATSLLDENTVALYSRSLITILREIMRAPGQKTKDLDPLSVVDKTRVAELSQGKRIPFADLLLDAMVDTHASRFPNADAIVFGDERVSYNTLRTRSDGIAAQLVQCGVQRGDVVGLYCQRTPDMVSGLFGILKSGAAYLPLSSQLPPERMEQMLQSAGVTTILTDGKAAVPGEKYTQCVIAESPDAFSPLSGRKTTDTAQVLFTSGSTGQPKGIMISHRSLSNLVRNLGQIYADGQVEQGVLASSSILFDAFTMEVIVPLVLGISVVLADESETMTPWMLTERMEKSGVQAMFATPSRMKMLLDDTRFRERLSGLKVVLSGGEAMSTALAAQLCSLCGGQVYNLYGPAEATVYVTAWQVNVDELPAIGYAVPNTDVYILDEYMRPVMPTAPGEIYIGGDCLSSGYIGSPNLTAAAFVADPLTGKPLYRTGDLARMRHNGRIEYLGRKDHQVKLNGQRIELQEITGAMMATGLVFNAAVAAIKSADKETVASLRGFVVPHKTAAFDESALRYALSKKLPPYMVPAEFTVVDAIPLTVTGKVDMRALSGMQGVAAALPAPEPQDPAPSPGKEADGKDRSGQRAVQILPEDRESVRKILKSLWREVLKAEEIDETRSFFEQGGASLSAMNLLIRYFEYGWKLKLNLLYEKPRLSEQLEYICEEYLQPQDKSAGEPAVSGPEPAFSQQGGSDSQAHAPVLTGGGKAGAVLITGATGFLGSHIVGELLHSGEKILYCLIRGESASFFDTLAYYFGQEWVDEYTDKIHLVSGDICAGNLGLEDAAYQELAQKIATVYHCAADVRHYAPEESVIKTNVTGTQNVIAFCKNANALLGFASTLSVGGEKILPHHKARYSGQKEVEFDESCVDIGQNWTDSVYVRSKFFAEAEVQKAAKSGLNAKILRVGRLVGRASDGKFQKNRESNYFYNVVTGMLQLESIPKEVCDTPLELTPVDSCAKAAVAAMKTQMDILHLSNPHMATVRTIVETLMRHANADRPDAPIAVSLLETEQYTARVLSASADQTMQAAALLNSSLALIGDGDIKVNIVCDKSNQALERLGFRWEKPDIATVLNEFFIEKEVKTN